MIVPFVKHDPFHCIGCGLSNDAELSWNHDVLKPNCPLTLGRNEYSLCDVFLCDIHGDLCPSNLIVVFLCNHAVCVSCATLLDPFRCPYCRASDKGFLILFDQIEQAPTEYTQIAPIDQIDHQIDQNIEEEETQENVRYVCANPLVTHLSLSPHCTICSMPAERIFGKFSSVTEKNTTSDELLFHRPFCRRRRIDDFAGSEGTRKALRRSFDTFS